MPGELIPVVRTWATEGRQRRPAAPYVCNGRGLSDVDGDGLLEHCEHPACMWCGSARDANDGIEFDLAGLAGLGSILVWNYNELGQTFRGIKTADISVWEPNKGWRVVKRGCEFPEAAGGFDYDEPLWIRLEGVKAQRVRFDNIESHDKGTQYGLAEVAFYQPRGAKPMRPDPPVGGRIDVQNPGLHWMAGERVIAHRVYLGSGPDSLELLGMVEGGRCADVPELQRNQWYCWRVDAELTDGSVCQGDLWSFHTGQMVAWYQFDADSSEKAIDASGNELHGRFDGDARVADDPERQYVLDLDGQGDYVYCGSHALFHLPGPFSFSVWAKSQPFSKKHQTIISKGDTSWRLQRSMESENICLGCSGLRVQGDGSDAYYGRIQAERNVNDGRWHHYVGVYDGQTLLLYIDGDLLASSNTRDRMNVSMYPLLIGANAEELGREWHGRIDDVRIYSYALTPEEVRALHVGNGPTVTPRPGWVDALSLR